MRFDFGYAEESRIGKSYDLNLLRRLLPFIRPYTRLLAGSIVLVVGITLLELWIPYITKIAIDSYILPTTSIDRFQTPAGSASGKQYLSIRLDNPAVRQVVRANKQHFTIQGDRAIIALEALDELGEDDLRILRSSDLSGLVKVTALFLMVISLDFGFNFIQQLTMQYAGHTIMHDLRLRLYEHLQELSIAFFNRNPVARLVTRVTNDVQNMHELFTSVISLVFKDLLLLVGIAGVLLFMNWRLALVSFAVLPLVALLAVNFSSQIREVYRRLRIAVAEINARFAETIAGIKVIQAFAKEESNYTDFQSLNHTNFELGMRQIHIFSLFMPVVEMLGVITMALLIYYGGGLVLKESVSLGALVAFISYMRMFFRPIRDLAEKYNILQNAMSSAERIFLLFDSQEKLPQVDDHPQPRAPLQSINFDAVKFAYVPEEPVLKGVSFVLPAGQTMAIVGPTGSGKTTLINLIIRFYDPTGGTIRLNGRDIAGLPLAQLRSRLALVTQDPYLFSGTLRDNILQGRKDLTPRALEEILEASHCAAWIRRLPEGLDTVIHEGGVSLSSGERQLISIARALARNPELIILDEATSYVDSATEQQLQAAMVNLMAGRTALVVAHRLSTARTAHQILVMKRGRVVERGSHASLMAQKGFYYHLNMLQHDQNEALSEVAATSPALERSLRRTPQ
jgi:ATP-binding cassette subfamily B multidrug efflux pump